MHIPIKFRQYFRLQFIALVIILLPAGISLAKDAPVSIPGTIKITAEGLIDLIDEIPKLVIVDSRIAGDRKNGYIEGSLSLPDIKTNCNSLAKIIPEKSAPTLYYCNGVKCGRSVKAINIAQTCGYSNIYWFRGGFEEWLDKGFPYLQG